MKRFTGLGVLLILAVCLSCGQQKDTTLTLSVSPNTSFILPGDDQPSCYTAKVVGPRIFFPGVSFSWNDTEAKFYPAIFRLTFKSNNLSSTVDCSIQDSITSKFRISTGSSSSSVTTSYFTAGDYVLTDGCAIECGGISVADTNKAFKISGEAKFVGYSIDDEGNQKPYTARATVFMENLP